MDKKGVIAIVIVLVIILVGGYFLYFQSKDCQTYKEFRKELLDCSRANYIREGDDAFWSYSIIGEEEGKCKVRVTLLQVKSGEVEMSILEGKKMYCYMPKGMIDKPESKINYCHGRLKEEIQNIIIDRLHSYITENLGEINKGLKETL